MKNYFSAFALLCCAGLLTTTAAFAGGSSDKDSADDAVITVGATPTPHAEILELIADDLAAEGYTLKVREFTDYVMPNEAVESGDIDANYFQHLPYMDSFNQEHGFHLKSLAGIHVEPMALYSKKYSNPADIPNKAVIAIPNDPTNGGRALLLLQSHGLITLDDAAGITATPLDIRDNPRQFVFKEIEAPSLPRVLNDVDAAVINGNYALPAGLTAKKDGILIEGSDSPYVNILAVKSGNEDLPKIKALVKALQSEEVRDYINKNYPDGDVVPVF